MVAIGQRDSLATPTSHRLTLSPTRGANTFSKSLFSIGKQVRVRGTERVDQMSVLTMAGYNLVRMHTLEQLGQVRPQGAH